MKEKIWTPEEVYSAYVPPAQARREDPETSHAASRAQTSQRRNELFTLLLEALDNSEDGLTMLEACRASAVEVQSGSPRFAQMRRLGMIEQVGERKNPGSNRLAAVWKRQTNG